MIQLWYIEILSTWEVWRTLERLELLEAWLLRPFCALQTSRVLNISTYARWHMNQFAK